MKAFTRGERAFLSVMMAIIISTIVVLSDIMMAFAADETTIIDVYSEEIVVSEAVKEEEDVLIAIDKPAEVSEEDTQEELTMPCAEEEVQEELTMFYTDEDVELLGRLVTSEAGALSYEEQRAVADTVIHRLDSEEWPNTISEVIDQPGQYATLPNEASKEAKEAAFFALEQWNLVKNGCNSEEEWSLPDEYVYFFGNGQHNIFYYYNNGKVTFYDALPNAPLPSDVYTQYRKIVLGAGETLKAAEAETEDDMYWESEVEADAENAAAEEVENLL